MADVSKEDVIDFISNMTVLELSEFVKELEDKFGVSAAAPVAVAAAAPGGAAQEEAAEQTEFDVILSAIGDKKIQVIKTVRAITSLGLKEAKALVDDAPGPVKEGIPKEEAENIKGQLEDSIGRKTEFNSPVYERDTKRPGYQIQVSPSMWKERLNTANDKQPKKPKKPKKSQTRSEYIA